jgi:hypothetical protein
MNIEDVNEWLEDRYINTNLSDENLTYLHNETVKNNIKELEIVLKITMLQTDKLTI